MKKKKKIIVITVSVVLLIMMLVLVLSLNSSKNKKTIKNSTTETKEVKKESSNKEIENEEAEDENETEEEQLEETKEETSTTATPASASNNQPAQSNSNNQSNNNTSHQQSAPVVAQPVQSSKTAQSNNYDSNISYLTFTMYSNEGYDAPGYNGELVYKFTKPVVYDNYSYTAYQRMGVIDNTFYSYATDIARNTFGANSAYCVAEVSHGFARNSSGLIVGIVSKAIIGTKDEYDTCGNDRRTVYLNNRINLTQDDSDGGRFR